MDYKTVLTTCTHCGCGCGFYKVTNEENYLLQKFARAAVGTNSVDHCARL